MSAIDPSDRLDPAVGLGDPDAAMGCVERGIRQRGRHFRHLKQAERKGNS